jgi:protein-tyrosine phosphatase
MKSLLFVCMGNICRSPLAEGIARHHAQRLQLPLHIDSAGIADYHVGEPPDLRATELARSRGTPISAQRARQVTAADLQRFDVILGADRSNLRALQALRTPASSAELALMLAWAGSDPEAEVPDPYYGGAADFEHVYDLLNQAMPALLRRAAFGS